MNRLLSINNYYYRRSGCDAVFLDHDALFRRAGWRTAVFCTRQPDNLPSAWSPYFVPGREYATLHLAGKLRAAPATLFSVRSRRGLARLVADFAPDVIHVHGVEHHLTPSLLAVAASSGVPVVMTLHDYKLVCPSGRLQVGGQPCERCLDGRVLPALLHRCSHGSLAASAVLVAETLLHRALGSYTRHIDAFVCPSDFLQATMRRAGWPADRLHRVDNFVDAGTWSPGGVRGRHLLYAGRLEAEKGVETLVRAAAVAGVPLRFVGGGSRAAAVRSLSQRLGVDAMFRDPVAAGDLRDEIRRCRALVLPSEWYENASMALLEAMACATPVVASRIGGNPELVADSHGWLFEPGDVDGLAGLLREICALPDGAIARLGAAGRERAVSRYGTSRYLEAMTALYARLVGPVARPVGAGGVPA